MNNLWLKIKIWTKITAFAVAALYVIFFVNRNWNATIDPSIDFPFLKTYTRPLLLNVLLATAALSVFAWWLIGTIFKTVRQIRDLRDRNRAARMEREVAEMKNKASMLQTKEATIPSAANAFPVIAKTEAPTTTDSTTP
jgi:hypothetical protein